VNWTVPTENIPAFLEMGAEARAHVERLGGKNNRAFQVRTGAATGSFISVFEFDDHAALGAFLDQSGADADFQAMVRKAAGLSTDVVVSILTEINM
jgi:DeoR/GlpR family transcriptional regulator of sugar metabolism